MSDLEFIRVRTPNLPEPKISTLAPISVQPPELRCWQGRGHAMDRAHRHDDIEVNLVSGAPLTYLFGGTLVEIEPGQAALFWAAVPHRLIDCPGNWAASVRWLHVPLASVLDWSLPAGTMSALLGGTPLVTADVRYPDPASFQRWSQDLLDPSPEQREITLLEIQAGVRRLLRGAGPGRDQLDTDSTTRHVVTMARFIANSFREPISAADVAAAAHLHPNYAMTLFRQLLGVTIRTYVTQRRIAESQRLLVTTDSTIEHIATDTGFGSPSSFYATFTRICGAPPGEYRRTHRHDLRTQEPPS